MECEHCGIDSEDVEKVIDPYIYKLYKEEEYRYLCPTCLEERLMDI